jgi:cysteine synthase
MNALGILTLTKKDSSIKRSIKEGIMASNSNFSVAVAALASFVCGVAVGMLIAPKSGRENRQWLKHKGGEVKDWIEEKGTKVIQKASEKLEQIRENLPDLYAATEDFHLKENDVL